MASEKKRQKAARQQRKSLQAGPFRHKDGDRRRRAGRTYEQGLAEKQAMQQLGAPPPPDA